MSDPVIDAKVFAARHLAANHLAAEAARVRRELGLRTLPRRNRAGKFVKAPR